MSASRCGLGRREDWNRRYADGEQLWNAQPNRFLVAEVERLPPARALDLACGQGRNAIWLAERGWRVTAVDFSDVGLATAERLAASRGVEVDWVLSDLLEYRPPSESFELVLILYLQLPPAGRQLVLERAAEALSPGGTLLVIGHDLLNLTEGYGGPTNPEVLFTPDVVVDELPGVVIERAERVKRTVARDDGDEVEAIDALVRARKADGG
jgi:SAM-dependent methyltransferase